MNCFDCLQDEITKPAVAICHHCGAGICPKHSAEKKVSVSKLVGLGKKVPLPLYARRLFCFECDEALSQPR